ncbi:globin [Gulosibacter molinativorax]|uniref:Globin n=1 Tax=Gulosibacter molinativorax TaxID=256821 RepID=A0ABT7C9C4_9MICO|nr:globin [Gulosibacter molinativorax]MDJ1371795.1 globin [Gulosibacter molinativorax]QUY60833.1 Group 2 truncated hemoglobin GlbO [Gulosibacter molinativorax]
MSDTPALTLYDEVGGMDPFEELVRRFYDDVQADEVLWPMYPKEDLEGAIWRLSRFLAQYWGGPSTYSEQRGHPRLRMRHVNFHVNPDARGRWLKHMTAAVDSMEFSPIARQQLLAYFDRAATAMVNTFEPTPDGERTTESR